MNDSRLSGIDPAKLQMLFSMSGQGASKSQNELMPFLMAVAARSRQNGMTFTPEETNLIIEVMKQGKSKEEKRIPAKRQHILQKRTLTNPRQQAGEYL